jgi:hypothetical protein
VPEIGIGDPGQELVLLAQPLHREPKAADQRAEMLVDDKAHLVPTPSQDAAKPDEWMDVAVTSKWNQQNVHGAVGLGSRQGGPNFVLAVAVDLDAGDSGPQSSRTPPRRPGWPENTRNLTNVIGPLPV